MNQDQVRRRAEEVLSIEELNAVALKALGFEITQDGNLRNFVNEAIAAALVKLTQGQEVCGWMRIVQGHTSFVVAETEWGYGIQKPDRPGLWMPLYTNCVSAAPSQQKDREWYEGYKSGVSDAINKPVVRGGVRIGFLAKPSASSVGEYVVIEFPDAQRGSINGLAAQVGYELRAAITAEQAKGREAVCALGCWSECNHKGALGCRENTTPPAQPARECEWQPYDDDNMPGTWQSGCGVLWTFTDGGPKENEINYCVGCGAKLREKNAGQPVVKEN